MDGTCTGEHGNGLGKRDKLVKERDIGAVAAMRAVKTALDPMNIMTPGKISPAHLSGNPAKVRPIRLEAAPNNHSGRHRPANGRHRQTREKMVRPERFERPALRFVV